MKIATRAKRFFLSSLCGGAFLAIAVGHSLSDDSGADKDMADRYLRAARSGNSTAQFYLGALYSAGIGVSQSDAQAFYWFSRAAEQGDSQSMLIVSALFAIGRGTPIDNIQGYKWASVVASTSKVQEFRNGASQLTSLLESRMAPNEIQQAKADAGRWRPADASGDLRSPEPALKAAGQSQSSVNNRATTTAGKESDYSGGKELRSDDWLSRVPKKIRERFGF